jgi:hypothetical protein
MPLYEQTEGFRINTTACKSGEVNMWRFAVCAFTAMSLAATAHAYGRPCPTEQDIPLLVDARLVALRTALQLTSEQETLWPAVEAAMRKFARLRFALISGTIDQSRHTPAIDVLRERAARMAATADALTRLVDAESAVYRTLDDAQKRRFDIMVHGMIAANAPACSH